MTLDEAIECEMKHRLNNDYHEQIAEWLEELKELRLENSQLYNEMQAIRALQHEYDAEIRNKAVDEFVKKISESNQGHWRVTRYEHGEAVAETMSYDIGIIKLIAEQLKGGGVNEVET